VNVGYGRREIDEWVRIVHEVGGLCVYDQANFDGVMGKIRARDLGFDARMSMLHKTFGAPKGGGSPAVGAFGCTAQLNRFPPSPVVARDGDCFTLDHDRPADIGKVREFWGNVPTVVKAYAWARAMGADGIERPPTPRCSRTTTWSSDSSRSRASPAPTRASTRIEWR
jgi:glycine dehydrogenase subunit 2